MTSDLSHSLDSFFKWIYSLISLVMIGFLFLLLSDPSSAEPSVPLAQDKSKETLLLVWAHPFRKQIQISDCWTKLAISGCKVTDNRDLYSQADAVLIHHQHVARGKGPLPLEPRPPGQKWIWLNTESPTNTRNLWKYEGIYNLTVSYREDSDVFLPYGYLIPVTQLDKLPQGRFAFSLKGRTSPSDLLRPRFVAWGVSRWNESRARVVYYKLLKDHIQIDLFGDAGEQIPGGRQNLLEVINQYQFYLAFENSQHTDYITEKLWNAVETGAIPVVLGPSRENYERFLPSEAFIHVDDFPTAQDLAQYLLTAKDNPSLIEKHLRWRKNYKICRPWWGRDYYCMACLAAKRNKGKIDVVKNLYEWYNS